MSVIAVILTAVLTAIAALHLMWAIGFWTPIRDEERLAKTVVGARGVTRMPGAIPCSLVALALAFAAVLPHQAGFPGRGILMPVIALVFLARGAAAYVPAWRALAPEEPFASLDRTIYGPLCAVIGVGYLILIVGEF